MEAFLKRRRMMETVADKANENEAKKLKTEICPHSIKCYRRNPHHFKEYDHPHLEKLLSEGEAFDLPTDFPQPRNVVEEQLAVLRDLRGLKLSKEAESGPSTSSAGPPRTSSKKKLTSFDPQRVAAGQSGPDQRTMSQKMEDTSPYNLFFTKIPDSPPTLNQNNSVEFADLLCPSLGDLKSSLQINFMIDIAWLMEQYKKHGQEKKPLTIVYGDEWPDMKQYIQMMLPNVTEHFVKMRDPFGIHHAKVGIYVYSDNSMRIVVSTANLYFEDWNYYCQGLWVSPLCHALPPGTPDPEDVGESRTHFKQQLLGYLSSYRVGVLRSWIDLVENTDFSHIKVCLITSAPGRHHPIDFPNHCHLQRTGELLSLHCTLPQKTTPQSEGPLAWGVIIQSSSMGNFGKTAGDWLRTILLRSLGSHTKETLPANSNATLSVIFPTVNNVLGSFYGPQGGGCLPYSTATHKKQLWLKDYLHEWKADRTGRSRAMPHIKSYCRVSPCLKKLAWYLLTSANISKAAWGSGVYMAKDKTQYIRSYEVGVMFLPKFFDEEYFAISEDAVGDQKLFPFMYDLPLSPYGAKDQPWSN